MSLAFYQHPEKNQGRSAAAAPRYHPFGGHGITWHSLTTSVFGHVFSMVTPTSRRHCPLGAACTGAARPNDRRDATQPSTRCCAVSRHGMWVTTSRGAVHALHTAGGTAGTTATVGAAVGAAVAEATGTGVADAAGAAVGAAASRRRRRGDGGRLWGSRRVGEGKDGRRRIGGHDRGWHLLPVGEDDGSVTRRVWEDKGSVV